MNEITQTDKQLEEQLKRFNEVMDEHYDFSSDKEMAQYFGSENASSAVVTNWRKRGVPDRVAIQIQLDYGINANWLLRGIRPRSFAPAPANNDLFVIEKYDVEASMGHGRAAPQQHAAIEQFQVDKQWLQKNIGSCTSLSNLRIITGIGDSMEGLFSDGDPIIIDLGIRRIDVDGVYFFRVGDDYFIKRLMRVPGKNIIRATSVNPGYDPFEITGDMDFEIGGKVIKVWQGKSL